ncbi:TorF family putative porin [Sphingomonas sp. ASV193]|uniref:TorF family putative porin n=1 Tax=Sphingomonas sp. ASV193 TaxID=3144405 RepID=UPI0032E8E89C
MNRVFGALPVVAFLAVAAGATPALADDLGGGFTINGGATVVSDYRFRGISQTDKNIAIQGTFTLSHSSGFYASVWGSSISDYVANGSNNEIDLIAGYKKAYKSTTVDVGVLYYYYPGSGGANTDFAEPYVKLTQAFGTASLTGTLAYAPKQKALTVDGIHKEDNLYLAADLAYPIAKTPFGLAAHIGHSYGPSYLTIGKGYTDWSVGGTFTRKALTVGLSYVDTNKSLYSPSGRNISKGGIVGSVGVAF